MNRDMEAANEMIRKNRCNGALNLENLTISNKIWQAIQKIVLSGEFSPSITHIYLEGSNIKLENIHEEILPMVSSV